MLQKKSDDATSVLEKHAQPAAHCCVFQVYTSTKREILQGKLQHQKRPNAQAVLSVYELHI